MVELPKVYTQEAEDKKIADDWGNGTERDRLRILLKAFGTRRSLPTTDDYGKVHRDATEDFRRNDYSEAQTYVDTLTRLVEFYEGLAENYLDALTGYGIRTNEYGDAVGYPFAITSHGNQVFGAIEVFDLEEQIRTPESRKSLWEDYIKPHLEIANKWDRDWIVENFPEEVAELAENNKEEE